MGKHSTERPKLPTQTEGPDTPEGDRQGRWVWLSGLGSHPGLGGQSPDFSQQFPEPSLFAEMHVVT